MVIVNSTVSLTSGNTFTTVQRLGKNLMELDTQSMLRRGKKNHAEAILRTVTPTLSGALRQRSPTALMKEVVLRWIRAFAGNRPYIWQRDSAFCHVYSTFMKLLSKHVYYMTVCNLIGLQVWTPWTIFPVSFWSLRPNNMLNGSCNQSWFNQLHQGTSKLFGQGHSHG